MKVLISEDASFVRKRYVHLVSRLPSVTSVVETSDVADTVQAILAERPALVLLDFHLPAGTALDVMRSLDDGDDRTRYFVLSASTEDIPMDLCLEAGAERVFDKAAQLLEALSAVRAIAIENERFIAVTENHGHDLSSAPGARGADNV